MRKISHLFTLFACISILQVYSQCDSIALIGEFSGWASDTVLVTDESNPNLCSLEISFNENDDTDQNGIIEIKFRTKGDWINNWGDNTFPSGIGVQDGANIPVPYGDYIVSFNCFTNEYLFTDHVGIREGRIQGYKLFPNPASNILHFSHASSIRSIEIYSLVGQRVHTQFNDGKQELEINISELGAGIFFVKTVSIEGLTLTRKFLKK